MRKFPWESLRWLYVSPESKLIAMAQKFDEYLREKNKSGEWHNVIPAPQGRYESTEVPKWDETKIITDTPKGGMMGELSLTHILILGLAVWWIYSLVHLLKGDRKDKVLWVIVLIGLSFLGAILYWTVGKKKAETP